MTNLNIYPNVPFDAVVFIGMIAITVLVTLRAAWVFSAGSVARRNAWIAAFATLMAVTGTLAATGIYARSDLRPPPLQLMIAATLVALLVYGLSARGRQAAQAASMPALVLLQGFRMPLEIIMVRAAFTGIMPKEFSFVGYNFDIITGAAALIIGLLLIKKVRVPPALIAVWNVWGIGCLLVIVALAIATSPNIAAFGNEPAHVSLWVLQFPYVWLPFVLVGIAVFGHVMISVKLWAVREPTALARAATRYI
jgi:hypothetical protein